MGVKAKRMPHRQTAALEHPLHHPLQVQQGDIGGFIFLFKRDSDCYRISYPAAAAAVLEQYNALETAPVEKHSKRGKKIIDLKEHIPQLRYTALGDTVQLELCLPAAQELNLNPSLLTGFLEEKFGLPAASANILRTKFLTADRQLFA